MNFTASSIKAHNGIRVDRDTSFSEAIKITPHKAANAKQKLARPTDAQGPPAPIWQHRAEASFVYSRDHSAYRININLQ